MPIIKCYDIKKNEKFNKENEIKIQKIKSQTRKNEKKATNFFFK